MYTTLLTSTRYQKWELLEAESIIPFQRNIYFVLKVINYIAQQFGVNITQDATAMAATLVSSQFITQIRNPRT